MFEMITQLGHRSIRFCCQIGYAGWFLSNLMTRLPRLRQIIPMLTEQLFALGVLSLLIIIVSGLFIGMVVALQGYNTLNQFGSSGQLGQLLALSITRELGPVITALLFAGRAGSALTAEIGLMKATDQLASMDMMGVDPIVRVVYPRFWAGVLALPLLSLIFSATAMVGGHLVGVEWLGIDAGQFWSHMQTSVDFYNDVLGGVIKSIVFGVLVTWIAVFQGYVCIPTSLGISQATTRTVVYGSLFVLGMDFILTALMMGGW